MVGGWQVLATVALLSLPSARAFNLFQDTSDQVFNPIDIADPFFSNFEFFPEEERDENNKLHPPAAATSAHEYEKSHEADLFANLPKTSATGASSYTPDSSPPKFDINTFTFNQENIRKADDIFSLLADVEGIKHTKSDKYSHIKPQDVASTKKKPLSTSTSIPGVSIANDLSKTILQATKDMDNLFSVVRRMKKKVYAKLGSNSSMLHTSSSSSSSSFSSNSSSALVDLLLNASELQEIQTAVLTSKSEEEFLDHLTSVLMGAETRGGGSALTLDPVTIIALLTLATYLIRAVYQILTVTGRSLLVDDLMLPMQLSDLPSAMVNVHNWVSSSNLALAREDRALHEVGSILDIPGNLAAIIKLHREGHRSCVRHFLCEQLQHRTQPEVTLTDIFVAALGFYFGETDLATYIDSTLARRSSCDVLPAGCSPHTVRDALYLEDLYTRASYKFFNFLVTINNFL
ncbi:uncharacterized protein [Panulirus ornatus]|uniref:uncharacterized protein n=1 Tax=Panulirus ornatus TaxID=150431 RepID=UPI003A863EC8